jgi:hypothetical protein
LQAKRVPPARATGKTIGFRETYSSERTPDFTYESVQNDLGWKFRGLFTDRSYALDTYRRLLRERGVTPHIGRHGVAHGSRLGTIRWVGERGFARLHAFNWLRTVTGEESTSTSRYLPRRR